MTAATLLARDLRVVPPAQVSADHFHAFAAHVEAAGQTAAASAGGPFAVLVTAVRPFALATLAALFEHDADAIAVLDEAQFQGRYVTLTPRPDRGYSLAVGPASEGLGDRRRSIRPPDLGSRSERA